MNALLTFVKGFVRTFLVRKKFAESTLHSGVLIDSESFLDKYTVLFKNVRMIRSQLGAYSYVQSESYICNTNIGPFCSIASNVNIGLAEHPMDMVSTSPIFYDDSQPLPRFIITSRTFSVDILRTIIGADVWIGHGAVIKAGVKIGVGSIIGAGAIVTKDIPPYTIAAGNPCRQIRPRFSEDIVSRLIASEWWTLSDTRLKEFSSLFADPVELLDALEQSK